MHYLKITSDSKKEILKLIESIKLKEQEFCLLTYDDDKSTHYFVSDLYKTAKLDALLSDLEIEFSIMDEKEVKRLSPLYENPPMSRGYLYIGNYNLMPFSI